MVKNNVPVYANPEKRMEKLQQKYIHIQKMIVLQGKKKIKEQI